MVSFAQSVQLVRIQEDLSTALDALELIAAGKRPDGSYNRCREACEQLAKETLVKIQGDKYHV